MVSDLVSVLPQEEADPPIYKLWRNEIIRNSPERLQVLNPHRGELHGVEALNIELQSVLTNDLIDRVGEVDGITLNDKVIQIQNRTSRRGLWDFGFAVGNARKVELLHGELGYVETTNLYR